MRILSDNSRLIGNVVLEHPSLSSTNTAAAELLQSEKPNEGTVVSAVAQTAGRGQMGNTWESAPGKNIAISVILYPIFLPVREQFSLSKAVALAVRDFLTPYIKASLRVKWPNDIYVADQKIAGILIQNALSGENLQSAIVGIGININQTKFVSAAPNPVSLYQLTGKYFDLATLRGDLYTALEFRYQQLQSTQRAVLEEDYLRYLYRNGAPSRFRRASDGSVFSGVIERVNASGQLVIRSERGAEHFGIREVSFVFP